MDYKERVALAKQCYLGESTIDDLSGTEFDGFGPIDWAQLWILKYGYYDGSHHKQWVLDQVLRILNGTEVVVTVAKWGPPISREEYRLSLADPSPGYLSLCEEEEIDPEDPDEVGIAP